MTGNHRDNASKGTAPSEGFMRRNDRIQIIIRRSIERGHDIGARYTVNRKFDFQTFVFFQGDGFSVTDHFPTRRVVVEEYALRINVLAGDCRPYRTFTENFRRPVVAVFRSKIYLTF